MTVQRIRIGQGFDVHPFVAGRKCILGGVEIPFEKGLDGHSDADVVLHALMDGLLGAIGESDIGVHFPNTSAELKNIDSTLLLAKVVDILRNKEWRVGNVDISILAQVPKISPYVAEMKQRISSLIGIDISDVSIKATTTEKLGFVGREEGIAAMAVVLVFGT